MDLRFNLNGHPNDNGGPELWDGDKKVSDVAKHAAKSYTLKHEAGKTPILIVEFHVTVADGVAKTSTITDMMSMGSGLATIKHGVLRGGLSQTGSDS